jgi:hypothetical protein
MLMSEAGVADPIVRYLEASFVEVDNELFSVYKRTLERKDQPGLIFPMRRGVDFQRVSEQEAKQVYLYILWRDQQCRFSVETPTCEPHGETQRRSANVDVSLFTCGHKLSAHIEFKDKNRDDIPSSLEKLVREEKVGGWFHTLENADQGTLPSIGRKLIHAFADIVHYLEDSEPHPCLFCFCIIKKKILLLRWITLGGEGSFAECEQAFRDLKVSSSTASSWTSYRLGEG